VWTLGFRRFCDPLVRARRLLAQGESLDDPLRAAARRARIGTVIGGGLLGLEAAKALQ
jgi:hypothetical protein